MTESAAYDESRPSAANAQGEVRRALVRSFGCQMNVYNSQRMADLAALEGYAEAEDVEDADLIVLNTCHIREKASEKLYSELGKLRELKEERRKSGKRTTLVVAGCVAQAEGAEILRRQPAVDLVVGPQSYHRLPELLRQAEVRSGVVDTDFPQEDKFSRLPPGSPDATRRRGPAAFVTVQEGCDKFCSFCVVPYTRGAEASRPAAAILDEIERLAGAGVREVMLIGQNVNAYHGVGDRGRTVGLAGLIRLAAAVPGIRRVRYATSHPKDMSDDLIAAHRDVDQLAPYLHLPVQSGSDRILASMNRRHTAAHYLDIVARARAARPDIALSSDFIVGYPGRSRSRLCARRSTLCAALASLRPTPSNFPRVRERRPPRWGGKSTSTSKRRASPNSRRCSSSSATPSIGPRSAGDSRFCSRSLAGARGRFLAGRLICSRSTRTARCRS